MPPSAEASRAPSSLQTVTRAFWICRSPAALCSWGVSTKLVTVSELTVRSAAGSTPGVVEVRDPLAQGVEIGDEGVAGVALTFAPAVGRVLPEGVWHNRFLIIFGVSWVWIKL